MSAVESRYMTFAERSSPSGRTVIVSVCNRRSGDLLGEIRWYGPWRQYCFYPEHNTIFNRGCMREICGYIDDLHDRKGRGE